MDPMFRSSQDSSSLLLQTTESAKSMISTLLKARGGGSGSSGSTMSEGLLFASQPPNLIERYSSLSAAVAATSSSSDLLLPKPDLLLRNGATSLLLGEKLKNSASSNSCTSGLTDVLSFTSKDSVFGFGFQSSKNSARGSSGSGDIAALLPQQKQRLIGKPPQPVAASRKKTDWYGDYYAQLPGRGDEEGNRDNGGNCRKNGACDLKPLFGRPAAKALIESNSSPPVNGGCYNGEPPSCEQQAARNLVSLVNGSNFPAPQQGLHHYWAQQNHRQGLSFCGENSNMPVHHHGRETSKQEMTMCQLAANAPWLAHGTTTSATASHVRAYCGPMSAPMPYPANSPLFEPTTPATATTYSRVATAVPQEANEVVATGEGGGNVVLLCQKKNPSLEVKGFVAPTDLDVIIGRGGKANNHLGNKRYLKLKDDIQKQERYIRASKQEKTVIAQEVVDAVRGWGGRFLKLDEETDEWREVENTIARKKASQALREINTAKQRAAKRERDRAAKLAKEKREQHQASSTKMQTHRTLHC